MLESQSINVGGTTYVVQPWPAMKAWKIQVTLGRVLKKSLSKLGAAVGPSQGKFSIDSELNFEKLGEAFAELFEVLDEDQAQRIVLLLLSGVYINGKPINEELFDIHFIGKIADVYKIISKVLEVNFGSFLALSGTGKQSKGQ